MTLSTQFKQNVCHRFEEVFHGGGNNHQIHEFSATTEMRGSGFRTINFLYTAQIAKEISENDSDKISLDSDQIAPTPNKQVYNNSNPANIIKCPVKTVCSQVESGDLRWGTCILRLSPLHMKGQYFQIHEIVDIDGVPPILHVDWRGCLVKTLHPLRIYKAGKRSGSNYAGAIQKRISYFQNGWQQYLQLQKAGIAVIPVYNYPDRDYFWLMPEVIPGIPPERLPEKGSGDLTDRQWTLLFRVAEICRLAIIHQIHIDLQPENVYLQPNGELALLDFREEQNPEDIEMDLRQGLRKFHNQNPEAKRLLERYLGDLIRWHLEEECNC